MRALITGAAGQDGTILAAHLTRHGVSVTGLIKPGTDRDRLMRYAPPVSMVDVDLADVEGVRAVIRDVEPTHIWNLGGFTAPGESWEHEQEIQRINVDAVAAMLEAAGGLTTPARFFQASSSHIFEGTDRSPQDETFELSPSSPYARSKAEALTLVRRYREEKGLFAVSGILYNHESPLRGENFVTRKVSMAVARIAQGLQGNLELGDIEVARDWGWAPDYVRATLLMLQADTPRDYVLATGISHRLSFFVQKAFAAVGIQDWQSYVVSRESDRRVDTNKMVGDSRSAYRDLGWRHTVDFDSIAARMVEHDLRLLQNPDALWSDPWMD
jgi:GDPmannose 4,6-dehydratase